MSAILKSNAFDSSDATVKLVNIIPSKIELILEEFKFPDAQNNRFGIDISIAYPDKRKDCFVVSKHETKPRAEEQYEFLNEKMKKGYYKIYISNSGEVKLEIS